MIGTPKTEEGFSKQEATVPKPRFLAFIYVFILFTNFKGFSL